MGVQHRPAPAEGLTRIRAARTVHGGRGAETRELRALIRELKAKIVMLRELV